MADSHDNVSWLQEWVRREFGEGPIKTANPWVQIETLDPGCLPTQSFCYVDNTLVGTSSRAQFVGDHFIATSTTASSIFPNITWINATGTNATVTNLYISGSVSGSISGNASSTNSTST